MRDAGKSNIDVLKICRVFERKSKDFQLVISLDQTRSKQATTDNEEGESLMIMRAMSPHTRLYPKNNTRSPFERLASHQLPRARLVPPNLVSRAQIGYHFETLVKPSTTFPLKPQLHGMFIARPSNFRSRICEDEKQILYSKYWPYQESLVRGYC